MHSWKRTSLEFLIFVHNLRDAIFGSKLAGIFDPRELCKWTGSFDTDFHCLRGPCCFGYTSQGINLVFLKMDFHHSELAMHASYF